MREVGHAPPEGGPYGCAAGARTGLDRGWRGVFRRFAAGVADGAEAGAEAQSGDTLVELDTVAVLEAFQ